MNLFLNLQLFLFGILLHVDHWGKTFDLPVKPTLSIKQRNASHQAVRWLWAQAAGFVMFVFYIFLLDFPPPMYLCGDRPTAVH